MLSYAVHVYQCMRASRMYCSRAVSYMCIAVEGESIAIGNSGFWDWLLSVVRSVVLRLRMQLSVV